MNLFNSWESTKILFIKISHKYNRKWIFINFEVFLNIHLKKAVKMN